MEGRFESDNDRPVERTDSRGPMKGEMEDDPTLFIQPLDRRGKPVEPEVIASARRSWRRLVPYAQQQGLDHAVVADVLEATVESLSSLRQRHPRLRERIKNLDHYIFALTIRKLNRMGAKEPPVEYVGSLNELSLLADAEGLDWISKVEDDLVLKRLIGFMNEWTKYVFGLRRMGVSWLDIGDALRMTASAVQMEFNRGVAKARRRLLGRAYSKTDPTPESGRPK